MTSHQVKSWFASVIFIVLIDYAPESKSQSITANNSPGTTPALIHKSTAPTLESISNGTFYNIYPQPITLNKGYWEGEPYVAGGASRPSVGLMNNAYLSGDLDKDGIEEAVVLLWQSTGGSGNFSYLAVFTELNGEASNISVAAIGDRVQIRSARIDDKQILLDVVQQGPNDAACCPSEKASRNWSLIDGELQEGSPEIEGLLSLADIANKEWQLVQLNRNEPLPQSVQVTLQIEGNRIAGKGPCNRYFAGVQAGDSAGEISIGQAGATKMACPAPLMPFEQKYLKLLSGVTRYSFMMGDLALSWQSENEYGTMIFKLAPRKSGG